MTELFRKALPEWTKRTNGDDYRSNLSERQYAKLILDLYLKISHPDATHQKHTWRPFMSDFSKQKRQTNNDDFLESETWVENGPPVVLDRYPQMIDRPVRDVNLVVMIRISERKKVQVKLK